MSRRDGHKAFNRGIGTERAFAPRPPHPDTGEMLQLILREIHRMSVDVSGVKAATDHAVATMNKLVDLVEKALASSSDAEDKVVQEQLDAIKASLDTAANAGDAEVVKATPAPPPVEPTA